MLDHEKLTESILTAKGRRKCCLHFKEFLEYARAEFIPKDGSAVPEDGVELYLAYLSKWAEGKAKIPRGPAREILVMAVEHALASAGIYHKDLEEV